MTHRLSKVYILISPSRSSIIIHCLLFRFLDPPLHFMMIYSICFLSTMIPPLYAFYFVLSPVSHNPVIPPRSCTLAMHFYTVMALTISSAAQRFGDRQRSSLGSCVMMFMHNTINAARLTKAVPKCSSFVL